MRRWPIGLAVWLLALAGAEVVSFLLVWSFFVRSERGQLLDTISLAGTSIGQTRVENLVNAILNTISVLSVVVATAVVGFIALIRRRFAVAAGAVLLIAGANVTTQVLKRLIYRPDLGIDPERVTAGNSLPSGHTTIVAAVAVALVLVLPPAQRGAGALLGGLVAAAAGVATLSADWHRPSDAVAALLVVGVWACAAGLFIIGAQRRHGDVEYGRPSLFALLLLGGAGLALLVGAAVALGLTEQVLSVPADELSRRRLFVAYAGGAMGIAGTASLVVATVLATAHRVVPAVLTPPPAQPDGRPTSRQHEGPYPAPPAGGADEGPDTTPHPPLT